MKLRVVSGVPGLAQARVTEIPVRADLGSCRAQVGPAFAQTVLTASTFASSKGTDPGIEDEAR